MLQACDIPGAFLPSEGQIRTNPPQHTPQAKYVWQMYWCLAAVGGGRCALQSVLPPVLRTQPQFLRKCKTLAIEMLHLLLGSEQAGSASKSHSFT